MGPLGSPPRGRVLPVLGTPAPAVRADASRNREALLRAARRLLEEVGAEELSMDALAAAAGLGKGTVFRRFGSRAGVFVALLDESERTFQQAVLSGPPPLGPGADPVERLEAFGRHRLRFLAERGDLLRAAAADLDRTGGAPAAFTRLHLQVLLRAAGVRGDLEVLAFDLLAVLEAPLNHYVRGAPGLSPQRLADGWADLVHRVARP
ncbi:TetR family transcriptional regulator [Kineococcus vitellinus]|uniref:TetR family transcriptional regulator n=1 Tax=Kineococcus vitellinus TaxID=2696565 RepID=UPI0030B81ACD